jgi:hypothetical protein
MVSGRRRLVSMAATGALGACCLAAVGCGGGSGSGSADPLASQPAATVVAEAIANLKAAPSVTVNSTGIASGLYQSGYMEVDPGKGCTGTTMMLIEPLRTWATATYVTIGKTTYFKPDSLMWGGLAGPSAATIAQKVNGRYVKDPVSDSHLGGLGTCVVGGWQTRAASVTKGQVTMLNGVRALQLKDSSGDVIYVTDTSTPEVVQFDLAPVPGTTSPANETTYTFGAPVKLTEPPASQVISGASVNF